MAELQMDAQINASHEGRDFQQEDTRRGQYLGFAIAGLAIAGAIFCAYLKQPVVASALLGVPLLSVAKALIDSARAAPIKPLQGASPVVPVSTVPPSPQATGSSAPTSANET